MDNSGIVAPSTRRWPLFILLLGLLAFAPALQAASLAAFKPPRLKHIRTWYPGAAQSGAYTREGWVNLRFMVSPAGKAYDVSVTSSTGGAIFRRAAVKQIKAATFSPATLAGKPVHAAHTQRLVFIANDDASGVTPSFYRPYLRALRVLKAERKGQALAQLKGLHPNTLQDDAYFALAMAQYSAKWGSRLDELEYVKRALSDDWSTKCERPNAAGFYGSSTGTHIALHRGNPYCLPDALYHSMLLQALELNIDLHRFPEALRLWDLVKPYRPPERASLERAIVRIKHILGKGLPYSVPGRLVTGVWDTALFERQFSVSVANGKIFEIDLYCQNGYVAFPFNAELQYSVHGNRGECELQLNGQPGTRFTLYQFSAPKSAPRLSHTN